MNLKKFRKSPVVKYICLNFKKSPVVKPPLLCTAISCPSMHTTVSPFPAHLQLIEIDHISDNIWSHLPIFGSVSIIFCPNFNATVSPFRAHLHLKKEKKTFHWILSRFGFILAEQHQITEIKEVQSAHFNGMYSYDLHTPVRVD